MNMSTRLKMSLNTGRVKSKLHDKQGQKEMSAKTEWTVIFCKEMQT